MCLGYIGAPGVMTLGGPDPQFYTGSVYYEPLVMEGDDEKANQPHAAYYTIKYLGMGAMGVDAGIPAGIGIVDTGNGESVVPQEMVDALNTMPLPQCSSDADCTINVQMDGYCLNIVDIMFCNDAGPMGKQCTFTGFSPYTNTTVNLQPGAGQFVFGYPMLRNLYPIFDYSNATMGFAERSNVPCQVPCSSYSTQEGCQVAEGCVWADGVCGGTASGGNDNGGSTITPGSCFS